MKERVYNVEKGRKKRERSDDDATPQPKQGRPKKGASITFRYPPISSNDEVDEIAVTRSHTALMKELAKDKPRKDVVLPLLKDTFTYRRSFIMYDARSVAEVLDLVLKKPGLY